MTSFTIDIVERKDGWQWTLYENGGAQFVELGEADTVEQASADARTRMIVRHREVAA